MLADVADLLRCPHCAGALTVADRTCECRAGHRFDIARQGYVTLLRRPATTTADTAAMVADRVAFTAAGHFAPITELIATAAAGTVAVEAGAGPGHYLAAVLPRLGPAARGVATDLSAYACRRSARIPRAGAVLADTWAGLPVRDSVADTVLTVFAPRNWAEFARICSATGRVLVVTPLPDHLAEVREARGLLGIEEGKHDRLLSGARPHLTHAGHEDLRYAIHLGPTDLRRLIGMGPNAFHGRGLGDEDPACTEVTVAVRLDMFSPAAPRR